MPIKVTQKENKERRIQITLKTYNNKITKTHTS